MQLLTCSVVGTEQEKFDTEPSLYVFVWVLMLRDSPLVRAWGLMSANDTGGLLLALALIT